MFVPVEGAVALGHFSLIPFSTSWILRRDNEERSVTKTGLVYPDFIRFKSTSFCYIWRLTTTKATEKVRVSAHRHTGAAAGPWTGL